MKLRRVLMFIVPIIMSLYAAVSIRINQLDAAQHLAEQALSSQKSSILDDETRVRGTITVVTITITNKTVIETITEASVITQTFVTETISTELTSVEPLTAESLITLSNRENISDASPYYNTNNATSGFV